MALADVVPSKRGSVPAPRSLHGDPALLGLIDRVKAGEREALDALTRLIRPHVERQLARYPVISEKGWEIATKCQDCLVSVHREPWNRLGPVTLLTDSLP